MWKRFNLTSQSRKNEQDWHTPASAFNAVELLVVVAIIAIIAAMVVPALSRAKSAANSTGCKNHLRQLGAALRMYVADNSGNFPVYMQSGPPFRHWSDGLASYRAASWWTNPAYHCPAYRGTNCYFLPGWTAFSWGSYGYNVMGTTAGTGLVQTATVKDYYLGLGWGEGSIDSSPVVYAPVAESKVRMPSEMFAIADSRVLNAAGDGKPMWVGYDRTFVGRGFLIDYDPPFQLRHGRDYNVVCCDGHVEGQPPATLFKPVTSATRWNNDHEPHPKGWP
jgi:competence protein ComGC